MPVPLLIVDRSLEGTARYEAVLALASAYAAAEAKDIVPVPELSLEGLPVWEGEPGKAWVALTLSTDFATWLLANSIGFVDANSVVLSPDLGTVSIEINTAFCVALAEGFRANGIECTVNQLSAYDTQSP